ncbi:MAG TPA: CBS domain-containing protein [Actinomycetota bacterium]|nr:CBS domain-containing protein [Actinomycetota bacterium]
MKIKDVMRRDFVSVRCDTSLFDVARAVLGSSGAAAVLDPDGHLAGIISESDLLPTDSAVRGPGRAARLLRAALAGPDPVWSTWSARLRAADVMTPPAAPVQEDDDPTEIGRGMLESNVRHVPVMRGTILVGILARPELLRLLRSSDLTLQRSIERLLWRCRFAPPDYNIDIDIDGGTVLVEGEVDHESDVRVVGSLIAGLDGVSGVKNLLSVRSQRTRALA